MLIKLELAKNSQAGNIDNYQNNTTQFIYLLDSISLCM